jgi:rfaE bifunctional protein kinase chain/domain
MLIGNKVMQENSLSVEQMNQHQKHVLENLGTLAGKRLVVVGDVGLDEYVLGNVSRISPEAPVPVVDVKNLEFRIGLAGNVAQNVASLGGEALMVGVVGGDPASEGLRDLLVNAGVDPEHLIVDESRPTTRKVRVMAEHHHIVRVDYENRRYLDAAVQEAVLSKVEALLPNADVLVLEDYAKGVFSENLCQKLISLAHIQGKRVLVDPHISSPRSFYRGADLLTPNRLEAFTMSQLQFDELAPPEDSLITVGQELMREIQAPNLVITQGKEGMSLFSDGSVRHLPTYARQVFDVTGAGDTVIAALGLAWASGFSLEQACVLANYAAGFVVGKVGCVPCRTEELRTYIQQSSAALEDQKMV